MNEYISRYFIKKIKIITEKKVINWSIFSLSLITARISDEKNAYLTSLFDIMGQPLFVLLIVSNDSKSLW